ncbi:bifunctional phosphoribosyl-AMP cyclohydrolase/phosphoribosyl-ATP diphosphatase [Luteibacter rhizovicinus DSM 16549]|uniref:Histidine biosynthesis bifunctional protein HisIE n=1 Tax=Luteibacter rhizovicinus DSM 16549 TaxID=1440763 RepID=A0A0G9HFE4_9GAMM|nr:bifunctional phosphoribosyl-AMP cyclohydrolase/phosphoribosyl-ATP diphosphatase HisIE [Luteibacter rhizovicinus]APG04892.1 bifunctional phosphoribosyl-AMP cyclohydrolase/phosphoribosyl-ATP diphosphatase [Luteibacter rhizovicinus DSM 16549]KLD68505.1 phosphoribosyl-ATP pyrophosphatase [Luteibacter rhizovicinus DSM 16549]KLD72937.1 phosphoribosyl-ATP pyrophosphatase [Xanthomonas hyacinthi DSM 19077]
MNETTPDFAKGDGLVPAIVQHAHSGEVLMLGYMDEAALAKTRASGLVTFFSRSKQRLWTKGETSGDSLALVDIRLDCDADTFLVRAIPAGPTCHTGTSSCFGGDVKPSLGFLGELDALVASRHTERPDGSYTTKLFEGGIRRMAQKVGEEGVETALAAVAEGNDALIGEAADLVFHLMVVLRARGIGFDAVAAKLAARHAG